MDTHCNDELSADMNEIIPGLFLGNKWSTSPDNLLQNNIECVVNVSCQEADVNRGRVPLYSHIIIEIGDNIHCSEQMKNNVLPQCLEFIDQHYEEENRKVLIHCSAGRSRSATVIISWLITRRGLTYEDAYKLVNSRRLIQPNQGFIKILKDLPIECI